MRTIWKNLWLLLPLGVLVSACSGSKDEQAETGANGSGELIEPGTSVGKIHAGMTSQQVRALLGEPQSMTANSLEYARLGFAVMPGPDGVVQIVMCGDVTGLNGPLVKRFHARTREGIGLGSSREELIKAYGEASNDEKLPGSRESMRYDSLGITFSLESGKVHHMIIRLRAPETNETPRSIEIAP